MGPADLVLAPLRAARLGLRALEDLNALAERARRDPDPVEEVRTRLDALIAALGEATVEIRAVRATAVALDGLVREVLLLGAALRATAERLDTTGSEILVGGQDLLRSTVRLDRHAVEVVAGGRDLVDVSERLEADLQVLRAALPRLLEGLDTVEELEGAVETVADTVEPLQGAAERVGRVTRRLSRSS